LLLLAVVEEEMAKASQASTEAREVDLELEQPQLVLGILPLQIQLKATTVLLGREILAVAVEDQPLQHLYKMEERVPLRV
jgi:hypothetical protein